MRQRLGLILLFAALLALGLLLVFVWGAPRLLEFEPEEGAQDVAQDAALRLTFSRRLESEKLESLLSFNPPVSGTLEWQETTLVFQPDQPWPAGATITVQLQAGVMAQGFPPIPLREGQEWNFKIHQPSLAYLFPASGPASLYWVDPASGEQNLLVESPAGILDYSVSSIEPVIYFSEQRGTEGSAIYRLDVQAINAGAQPASSETTQNPSSTPELLLDCPQAICRGLALEPESNYLAYERNALPGGEGLQDPQVWILPLDGAADQQPYLAADPTHQTELPIWSSTGLLAYYDRQDLVYRFIEPGLVERAELPNQTGQQGAWRPDGGAFLAPEIIFLNELVSPELSNLESLADSHLILFHLDDGRVEDLTPGDGVEDAVPVYSPNGEYLVFSRKYLDIQNWTPGRQLWIARVNSREARPLTDDPLYNHFDFSWDSTSDQLAFVRFNQSSLIEPPEIWIFDLLSNQARRLVEGGFKPLWIP